VLIDGCSDTTVVIQGKVNGVLIEGCKKTQVVMETVISSVDVSNCTRTNFQITGSCPTASIDKTNSCNIYLMNDEAKKMQINTSKHADVQVTYLVGDDPVEKPIPEQFVHSIQKDHSVKTKVSSLYSGEADKADEGLPFGAQKTDGGEYKVPEGEPDPRCVQQENGKQWIIEKQTGGDPIKCFKQEKHHALLIDRCTDATVVITGKINVVSVNACKNTKVLMDDVISATDVCNSQKIQFQVNNSCPTASIDKTDGCSAFLMSEASKNIQLSTSKHSDVQVTFMVGDEAVEKPIPAAFVHSIQADGSVKSEVSSLYS
jgi:hypothetical protein